MSYEMPDTNLSGLAVITNPSSDLRTLPENFISKYDYAMIYQPDLLRQLTFANGKGNITGFLRSASGGGYKTYKSDEVKHSEMGRLTNHAEGVTIAAGIATFLTPHQLRERDVVKISDGDKEYQAVVSQVLTNKTLKLLNDGVGSLPTTPVTVICDYSSRFEKGAAGFSQGKKWAPKIYTNYSHIIKDYYEIADSDLAHAVWVETKDGPKWMHTEMERFNTQFGNKEELTILLNERAADNSESTQAGIAQGMNGVIPTIEQRGNVSNNYITTAEDLSAIAKRAKKQGQCREYTFWCSHDQLAHIRRLASSLNAAFLNGSHYGAFNNSKDMALFLDFTSIYIDGVQFHFCPWALLDDPTILAATNFDKTSFAYVGIPSGNTNAYNGDGTAESMPFLDVLYRVDNGMDRRRVTKGWGVFGTQAKEDKSSVELITECTNRVVAANNFFIGRVGTFYA